MKDENFGTIMNNGKIVNLNTAKLEDLEKLSKEFDAKEKNLKEKIRAVFKQ